MKGQKIRIRIKSFCAEYADASAKKIAETALRAEGHVSGPIALPMKIEKWTVNRGPYIDKKSREQFERRTYKRLLDISGCTAETVDALSQMKLPFSGVSVDIKILERKGKK